MKKWSVLLAAMLLLGLCGCGQKEAEETQWDCSLHCAAASTEEAYVITWSEAEVTAKTGALTFQNRNGFPVTVHLGAGKDVFVEEIQPGGVCSWLQADRETVYTVGLHADVEENTKILCMVYDGNQADLF